MLLAIFVLIATILFFDQLSKVLILKYIGLNKSFVLLKNILSITPALNTGGGFGILKNKTYLFIAIAAIAIVFLLYIIGDTLYIIYGKQKQGVSRQRQIFLYSISMILAGACGNLIDRIRVGAVIDFIDFKIWPVFNIADSCITIGSILLAWQLLKARK